MTENDFWLKKKKKKKFFSVTETLNEEFQSFYKSDKISMTEFDYSLEQGRTKPCTVKIRPCAVF